MTRPGGARLPLLYDEARILIGELMAERKYGAPAPETDTMVSGADWSGQDISR
jgi:hypothetical protein